MKHAHLSRKLMQLDVESLRAFLAVLDHGGMTPAAERLHLGQSAVSRKIQRLEARVGRPLLIRDGHLYRPTRDGRSLLEDARSIVDLHDRAVARLQSSDLTGTIKLSCNGEVDTTQIASLLGTFRYEHPGACVEFILDHSSSLIEWIDAGMIDVAIFQVATDSVRTSDIVLWKDELSWVTSRESTFSDGPIPLVDFGAHCYYNSFTHAILEMAGVEYRSVFSAASSSDVRAAVQAGIGVAVMSTRYIGDDVVEWQPPAALAPLPSVAQIVRIVPGERPDTVAALVDAIRAELAPSRATSEQ